MEPTSFLVFTFLIGFCFKNSNSFPQQDQELGQWSKSSRCFFYASHYTCKSEADLNVVNKNLGKTESGVHSTTKAEEKLQNQKLLLKNNPSPYQYFTQDIDGNNENEGDGFTEMIDKLYSNFEKEQQLNTDLISFIPLKKKAMRENESEVPSKDEEDKQELSVLKKIQEEEQRQKLNHAIIFLLLLQKNPLNLTQEKPIFPEPALDIPHTTSEHKDESEEIRPLDEEYFKNVFPPSLPDFALEDNESLEESPHDSGMEEDMDNTSNGESSEDMEADNHKNEPQFPAWCFNCNLRKATGQRETVLTSEEEEKDYLYNEY